MLSAKYCICGGNMVVEETREREYGVYRRRKCDCCGRKVSTREVYYGLQGDEDKAGQSDSQQQGTETNL